ncbi:MAG: hypothetical protein RSB51_03330 [Clostridia bacterium]
MKTPNKQKTEILVIAAVLIILIILLVFSNIKKLDMFTKKDIEESKKDYTLDNSILEETLAKKETVLNEKNNEVEDEVKDIEEAKSSSVINSNNFIEVTENRKRTKLECPKNLIINRKNMQVNFSKVERAGSYKVRIDNVLTKTTKEYTVIGLELCFSEYVKEPGMYEISVKAIPMDVYKYVESAYSPKVTLDNRKKIDTPKYLNYNNGKLTWEKIDQAMSYKVYLENKITGDIEIKDTKENELKITLNELANVIYTVRVKAYVEPNNMQLIESNKSKKIDIDNRIKLEQVNSKTINFKEDKITWEKVKNADMYTLNFKDNINNKVTSFTVENIAYIDANRLEKSNYNLQIIACSKDEKMYTSSLPSNVVNIDRRLSASATNCIYLKEDEKTIIWNAVNEAKEYIVSITYYKDGKVSEFEKIEKVKKEEYKITKSKDDFDNFDVKIKTVPYSNMLKESPYSKVAYFPYVRSMEFKNPDETSDLYMLIIEMKTGSIESGEIIFENSAAKVQPVTAKDVVNTEDPNKKAITITEASNLKPGTYTLKFNYKIYATDVIEGSISKKVDVKARVEEIATKVVTAAGNIEYNIKADDKISKYQVILKRNGILVLDETYDISKAVYKLTEEISENKNLQPGDYNLTIKPIIKEEYNTTYVVSQSSIYKEELVKVDNLRVVENDKIKKETNGLETTYIAQNKDGYKFIKWSYVNSITEDYTNKYYYKDAEKVNEITVKTENDTSDLKAIYEKIK